MAYTPLLDRAARIAPVVPDPIQLPAPAGSDPILNYWWYPQSPDPQDATPRQSAIETSLLAVTTGGPTDERVGYLRISFTNAALDAAAFPTMLHWLDDNKGWCLSAEPARSWASLHHYARKVPASLRGTDARPGGLTEAMAPDRATIDADNKVITDTFLAERAAHLTALSVPFVAYSGVHDDWLRQKVATNMYVAAAIKLGTQGLILRASGLQSDTAKALWAHLVADERIRTTTTTMIWHGQTKTNPALDYMT